MSNTPTLPLQLCQVLEEEYINLHSQIEPKPGWLFSEGQFKRDGLNRLVSKLAAANEPLTAHIKTREAFENFKPDQLISTLNTLLLDPGLYSEEAFAQVSLREETQEFVELGLDGSDIVFECDDLQHFNRLLLEDAYADCIRRIHEIRLNSIVGLIHKKEPAALCLSGGGMRSGSFALGIIQGLARHNLLNQFTYLSTVSGGGYIGSWLSAWTHRHPDGLAGVTEELKHNPKDSKIEPDPEPVRYLRNYSNFITPKLGLLSADVWAFAAVYFRNLILNWLVLVPLLVSVLAIPRLGIAAVQEQAAEWLKWGCFGLGSLSTSWAIAYVSMNRPSASDSLKARGGVLQRRTDQQSFLLLCLIPLILSGMLLSAFWAWFRHFQDSQEHLENQIISGFAGYLPDWALYSWFVFMLYGLAIHLVGWAVYAIWLRKFRTSDLATVFVTGPVGGWLLWLMATKVFPNPVPSPKEDATHPDPITGLFVCLALPLFMATFFLAATFFVGISSRRGWGRQVTQKWSVRPSPWISSRFVLEDEDREWLARFGGWLLIVILVWSIASPLVILGPLAIHRLPEIIASVGGISFLFSILAGRSANTPATKENAAKGGVYSLLMHNALSLAAVVFLMFLTASLSFLTCLIIKWLFTKSPIIDISNWALVDRVTSMDSERIIEQLRPAIFNDDSEPAGRASLMKNIYYAPWWIVAGVSLFLLGFGLLMSKLINLNKFSLHSAYRDRLIRAFLGASRNNIERKPNAFTGFDPSDNVQMHELRVGLLRPNSFRGREAGLTKFVLRLQAAPVANDPPAEFLRSRLSPETVDMLDSYDNPRVPSPSLQVNLIEDLNRILESAEIFADEAFAKSNMADRTQVLFEQLPLAEQNEAAAKAIASLAQTPKNEHIKKTVGQLLRGDYLILFNRLLLDQFFAEEIEPLRYPPPPYRLMHVVNTALNLVSGEKLAWQQRRAESFSISPLHCGSLYGGYRRSREYGGRDGVSLGTAAAISGAAVNSNMGYYSTSPLVTLVLTFFNARLGWWLGNAGAAGHGYYHLAFPKSAVYPIIAEAFGWTDDKNNYVLLSDGGHFENLGLYEMVLRRCKVIVVVDGSRDVKGEFADLGNAVRKIRIDLGIPIEFDRVPIHTREEKNKGGEGRYCAIGRIRYSCADNVGGKKAGDGFLIYIKPAFYGDEPRDIFNYAKTNPDFPHESTADQWFDEPQFESHRMLGSFIMDKICGDDSDPLTIKQLLGKADDHSNSKEKPLLPLMDWRLPQDSR